MSAQKISGYPNDNGRKLTDFGGRVIGTGQVINSTRVKPGARGAWISNERVSYHFNVDGRWYSCRGRGDGIVASCRAMKRPPR